MAIVDEFWRLYNQLLFLHNYYSMKRAVLIATSNWISIASFVVSAASIAGWGIKTEYAVVWAAIIFVSQLANGLKDILETPKKVYALDLYLPESASLANESADAWREMLLGRLSEEEIFNKIRQFSSRDIELKKMYILPNRLGLSNWLIKRASERTDKELEALHGRD